MLSSIQGNRLERNKKSKEKMEQRGTPEVLQAVFVVLPELERKK